MSESAATRAGRPGEGLHVLFVSQEYAPAPPVGGIGTYTRALARALAEQGCRVTVISCGSGAPSGVSADGGVTVHRVPLPAPSSRLMRRFAARAPQTASRLLLARGVARAIRSLKLRPDVVEAPEWGAEALLLRLATRAPLVVHLHSPMYTLLRRRGRPLTRDQRLAASLERIAARRADVVTAGALAANQVDDTTTWLPPDRIRIVPTPVDQALLSEPPGSWPRPPALVACGRLDQLKAPEVLVRAAARLLPETPGLRVVLIGEADGRDAPKYGDYGHWVAEVAAALGVPLEITGRLPWSEVVDRYRAASAVVVPSRYETFSMVALEAMACGTPAIVTSACGIAEHQRLLDPGWVVPPDDPAALAEALRPLLSQPDHAASRGAAARDFVRAHFSPAIAAAARLDLYASLIGPPRESSG
jgi:glycosyltransferase involved in cell wall biosynthesis